MTKLTETVQAILVAADRYQEAKGSPPRQYTGLGYDRYLERAMRARERFEQEVETAVRQAMQQARWDDLPQTFGAGDRILLDGKPGVIVSRAGWMVRIAMDGAEGTTEKDLDSLLVYKRLKREPAPEVKADA